MMVRNSLIVVVLGVVTACAAPMPKCGGCISNGMCVSELVSPSTPQTCGFGGAMEGTGAAAMISTVRAENTRAPYLGQPNPSSERRSAQKSFGIRRPRSHGERRPTANAGGRLERAH